MRAGIFYYNEPKNVLIIDTLEKALGKVVTIYPYFLRGGSITGLVSGIFEKENQLKLRCKTMAGGVFNELVISSIDRVKVWKDEDSIVWRLENNI